MPETKDDTPQSEPSKKVVPAAITEEMKKAYLDYAMSVIVSRALPDVRDGLKPVQRRIIYAMHTQGMHHNQRYQKCAAVVGETMKKYHPHGDMAIYDTLVRMAQDFSLRYTLIDGQGNFGSIDGDAPAAMRYTECRLEKITDEILRDIDKETVDYGPNYSGEAEEPLLLPALIPNLLLNGVTGIAVGMATNIPPHNLGETIDALVYMIENPENGNKRQETGDKEQESEDQTAGLQAQQTSFELPTPRFESAATVEDLVKFIKGPDFPTGGEIYGHEDVVQAYATGRGRIVMQAKTEIEELKGGKMAVIVTELPYQTNKALLVAKIADLAKEKKIDGITDLRDESDRQGMRIVIELKRDIIPQRILNLLYKHTDLRSAFNVNAVALIHGEPKTLTLKMILEEFVRHRQVVVIRRTEYLLKKAKEREHILQGLKIALDHLDEVIETIKKSPDADVAKERLMKKFKLTEIQAQAILDMQLRRLAALERKKIEDELKEIIQAIKDFEALLASPQKILDLIKKELLEIKEKYADERKTKVFKNKVGEIADEELIAEEETIVTVTESGYIKRLPITTYRKQGRGGKGVAGTTLKEEDVVEEIRVCNTHDDALFFTDKGRVFSIKVWDIPEASRTAKGTPIVNLIEISQKENISAFVTLSKQNKDKFLFMATEGGTVKKTPLDQFEKIRRTGIIAIRLSDDDNLAWVKPTSGDDEVILCTSQGQAIKFHEEGVRPMGRAAGGVRGIKLSKKDDRVVGMDVIVKDGENPQLMVLMANGYGKRTDVSGYKQQNRGGSGVLTSRVNNKTGQVVSARLVDKTTEDMLITSTEGHVIRLPLKDVPVLGRATQGVRLIRLNPGDSAASLACFEKNGE